MTPRTVTTVDFREIKAIEVRCNVCNSIASLPLSRQKLPSQVNCVGCGAMLWRTDGMNASSTPGYLALLGLLRVLHPWQIEKDAPFTLQFTLEADASRDKSGAGT